MQEFTLPGTAYLEAAAGALIKAAGNRKIWLFDAPMGAGKTTLIQAVCKALRLQGAFSSPTYSIVNEYHGPGGQAAYHMDLYRLKDLDEALDIGIEEYLYSGAYCFIEWPGLIEPLLPDGCFRIKMTIESDSERKILFL